MIDLITPKLLGNRPNTYTLTKALAESQFEIDSVGLPVIVVRPSIVGAMWKSPLPGWTDNINGPTGIMVGVGKGVLTNMCGNIDSKADIIPVDIVANMIIVCGAHRATSHYDAIPILHCASGDLNPLKWGKLVNFLPQFYKKYPMEQCFGVPSSHFHRFRNGFLFNYYYKHYFPAKLLDMVQTVVGGKSNNVRLYGKIWKMIEALHFFTTRGWDFKSQALPALLEKMHPEDKEEFNFDIRQVNWDSYLFDYIMGIKRYILKENFESLPQAKYNLNILRFKRILVQSAAWYLIVRTFGSNWKTQKKWLVWLGGFVGTHMYLDMDFRKTIHMKSLEEYKKTMNFTPPESRSQA
ncbi:unnamed protein product [Caenorhabditis auriculariae]|uniref:Fatty acyl-CoA reductase n=1 Tax=Caenorhabditis auriculariae TaxID=2777116 RepID=A0A8S1HAG3_9PELO|nr:unnamed protein product [Caenorhabditis auriculariae]